MIMMKYVLITMPQFGLVVLGNSGSRELTSEEVRNRLKSFRYPRYEDEERGKDRQLSVGIRNR